MVICSFFLKGNCRYGNRCKDEHVFNSAHHSSVLKKNTDVDITVLINSVSQDAIKSEKGGQWPLSCYGPFQQKPCFPGFEDRCFEEIRLGYYEAQKNGTLEQYTQQLKQILEDTRNKIRALQTPSQEITQIIHDIYHAKNSSASVSSNGVFSNQNAGVQQNSVFGNKSGSIFGNQQPSNPSNFTFSLPENKSVFGNTSNQQGFQSGNSVFGKPQNVFTSTQSIFSNNTVQPVQSGSLFQQTQQLTPNNTNIFGNPTTTPVFGNTGSSTSIFANQPTATANVFGNQPTSTTNVFASQPSTTNVFASQPSTTNVFASQPTSTTNVFASQPTTTNVFGNQQPTTTNVFASPIQSSQNIFATPAAPNANIFATPQTNVFNQQSNSVFAQPVAQQQNIFATANSNSPFAQQAFNQKPPPPAYNPFGANTQSDNPFAPKLIDDPTVYSRLEDLTSEDILEYKQEKFSFGKIPTRAPPLGMC